MKEYFEIIRAALAEDRKKGDVYYEAHHIIPKSFGKKSSTVLLTPQEHYKVHKLLAEYWKSHTVYGKKMLWAFHRLAYDGTRQLTEEEFAQARRILVPLWGRSKTETHKQNIANTRRGKRTIVHPVTREIRYVMEEQLATWIKQGWENTNYKKGVTGNLSEEGREKLAEARRRIQTGKTGLEAQAAKGPYTVIYQTGERITAGSYPELSKVTGIAVTTLQNRVVTAPGILKRGFSVIRG